MAVPLTNMKHLPFEHIDVTATAHHFARVALNRLATNVNLTICKGTLEMYLNSLVKALLKSQSNINRN
jgi:hypothetical protein